MENSDTLKSEIKALRERLSRLRKASQRISESPDTGAVLREVVMDACTLTGAGIGGITTRDGSGKMFDFVTHGLSPNEQRKLVDLPQWARLWDYLRALPVPLRLKDLASHLASLELPGHALMERSFMSMPVRHQGEPVGIFYLLGKEDAQEFTIEDEEIFVLFASLSGAAIANSCKLLDEQQARAKLEALIETTPVGVVVIDARSGTLLSINRESRRIVGDLCKPGQPAEELLKVVEVHRANGYEIVNEGYLLDWLLGDAETIRAEEITIKVPDGRKVTALINATAIVSDTGEVASVVVTMQDMTPLEELERQRSEFMSLVSHELTAPLSTIKGCTTTAVDSSSILSTAESELFFRIIDIQADHMRKLIRDLMDSTKIETGSLTLSTEPEELVAMVEKARNKFIEGGRRNPVQIDLSPDLPRVRADQHRIVQVLVNLLTNAARHSPDSATIEVAARLKSVYVEVSVVDEGPGIPTERMPHLFRKYARSGGEDRGVGVDLGLAICKGLVEAHGGRIWADSEGTGMGTRFTFSIPAVEEARTDAGQAPGRMRPQFVQGDSGKPLVLVVDDDTQALGYIRETVEKAGYRTAVTGDPEKVNGMVEIHQPDLVLLDLLLPGTDGIELMKNLPEKSDRPVIFLSAYGRDETIARALELGAADYIVKPFSPTELIARIQAALRRHTGPPEPFQAGGLVINYEERRVELKGTPLRLTATEYDLLRVLSTHAGRIVTYDKLLSSVWQMRNSVDARVVRVFVKRLRRMLGDDAKNPTYIFTEPRVGYRMARPDDLRERLSSPR
ncbi:MAG: response regulator [Gemmatimonadetes bacterium]|nr:response regulator [Gemmatimonadota bacterium]